MNAVTKKKKRNLSTAGPSPKWKGTLTLNLKHPLPTSLCVCMHMCVPVLTSISGSLWEENGFNAGVYVYYWILGGDCCSICRQMRCAVEPEWIGLRGAGVRRGRRGERRMEIRASRTLFFFF